MEIIIKDSRPATRAINKLTKGTVFTYESLVEDSTFVGIVTKAATASEGGEFVDLDSSLTDGNNIPFERVGAQDNSKVVILKIDTVSVSFGA